MNDLKLDTLQFDVLSDGTTLTVMTEFMVKLTAHEVVDDGIHSTVGIAQPMGYQ